MLHRLRHLAVAAAATVALVPAASAEEVNVAIGQLGLWDTLPTVFAEENGYFDKLGLEVHHIKTSGGAETVQTVTAGDMHFGLTTGILGAIAAFAKGAPIKIVSSEMVGLADIFWYVKADSKLKTVKDINGAQIAYSRPGSGTHLTMLTLASYLNLSPKLVSVGGIAASRTALMSGQIDAGWSVPPFSLDLVQQGKARVLFKGSVVKPLAETTIRVNVANSRWLEENRETARKFMIGYVQALDWMYGHGKEEATKRFAKMNNLDIEVAKRAVDFYEKAFNAVAPIHNLDKAIALAVEHKFIDAPLTDAQKKEMVDIVYDPRK